VTPRRWRQIWLNEGFATWSEWYWHAHTGGATTAARFDRLYATPASDEDFWNPPPGDPGRPSNLFDSTIYDRGGMTLEALRQQVGNQAFFQILRDWVRRHRFGNASTRQFVRLAAKDSGRDLEGFFHDWLFERGKPTRP
jgi:aminopeptidase N